jgi:hypothetical protein
MISLGLGIVFTIIGIFSLYRDIKKYLLLKRDLKRVAQKPPKLHKAELDITIDIVVLIGGLGLISLFISGK